MKYFVKLPGVGAEHQVVINGSGVRVDGDEVHASLVEIEGSPVRLLRIGDTTHRVVVRRGAERGRYVLWIQGHRIEVEVLDERARAIRALAGAAAGPKGPPALVAPMPGLIVRVNVEVGARVTAGQGLVVMEAMKMENELRTNAAGVVKAVRAAVGTAVEKGAVLIELDPDPS